MEALLIAWTTVGDEAAAQQLAHDLVESGLAVCVQINSGIQSIYKWKGEICHDAEWRLLVKFLANHTGELQHFIRGKHPYDTPEWIVVHPEHIDPKYLAWAQEGA